MKLLRRPFLSHCARVVDEFVTRRVTAADATVTTPAAAARREQHALRCRHDCERRYGQRLAVASHQSGAKAPQAGMQVSDRSAWVGGAEAIQTGTHLSDRGSWVGQRSVQH